MEQRCLVGGGETNNNLKMLKILHRIRRSKSAARSTVHRLAWRTVETFKSEAEKISTALKQAERMNGRWESGVFYASRTESGKKEREGERDGDSECCEALPSCCLSSLCLIGLPPPSSPHLLPPSSSHPPLPAVAQAMEASEAAGPPHPHPPCPTPDWLMERQERRGGEGGGATDF